MVYCYFWQLSPLFLSASTQPISAATGFFWLARHHHKASQIRIPPCSADEVIYKEAQTRSGQITKRQYHGESLSRLLACLLRTILTPGTPGHSISSQVVYRRASLAGRHAMPIFPHHAVVEPKRHGRASKTARHCFENWPASFVQSRPVPSQPANRMTKSPSLYTPSLLVHPSLPYAFIVLCGMMASFDKMVGCHCTMCS